MGRRNSSRPPKRKRLVVPDFPTVENCDPNVPEEFAVWALVGLPGQTGAPLPLPVKILRLVSKRLWDAGFRFHPELRTIKYRKPRGSDPNFLTSPGSWVPIDEPDEGEVTPEQAVKKLSPEQKAALRKQFGLDDEPPAPVLPEDDRVPYVRADGSTVMVTASQARQYARAKKARREAQGGDA